jgi:hypothetical protein
MRFVQIETLPAGKALVDIDKLTHAVPEGDGSRLFLGAQHIDVPHSLSELENVLVGSVPTPARTAGPGSACDEEGSSPRWRQALKRPVLTHSVPRPVAVPLQCGAGTQGGARSVK